MWRLPSAAGHPEDFAGTSARERINSPEIQGPDTTTKFGGIVWSGKMHVGPEIGIDKIQAYPTPWYIKEMQAFVVD